MALPKLEAAGPGTKRLLRGDKIVAFLFLMANNRWGVFDTEENPLTRQTFDTPAKARRTFVELEQAEPLSETNT